MILRLSSYYLMDDIKDIYDKHKNLVYNLDLSYLANKEEAAIQITIRLYFTFIKMDRLRKK